MRFEPFAIEEKDRARRLDRLRWGFRKWDLYVHGRCTVAPGAIVLDPDEHRALVAAAETLAGLAMEARGRIRSDDAASLGIAPDVAALAEGSRGGDCITRIDFLLTSDGWRATEFNEDVPGGFNDALGLPGVFHDVLPPGTGLAGDLPAALVRFLSGGSDAPVGLLYATAYAEDKQIVELLGDLLALHGIDVAAGSPAHVQGGPQGARLDGVPVERLFRFFPVEWFPLLPNAADWISSAPWGAQVVNPFSTAWTQSKAIFGWLHANTSGARREAVTRYLPWTALLDAQTAERALHDAHRSVLKPAFGRMGEGVTLGWEVPGDAWRKRIIGALRDRRVRPHVVQERIRTVSLDIGAGRSASVCIGAYAVNGRFAGYYGRIGRREVTAYDATNVLVVVEGL